jgi:steroid delta-isomerase-like uncharacterized protein
MSPSSTLPPIVTSWASAWNENRGEDLAALFAEDCVYDDLAFQGTWQGRDQVAWWVGRTHETLANVQVEVRTGFRTDDMVAIEWTFSGQLRVAPSGFAVPVTTILQLDGELITRNSDNYNLAVVLRQSGLPADWTPGA